MKIPSRWDGKISWNLIGSNFKLSVVIRHYSEKALLKSMERVSEEDYWYVIRPNWHNDLNFNENLKIL